MSNETFPRQTGILSRQLTRRVALLSLIAILGLVAVVVTGLVSSLQATQRQLDRAGSTVTITIDDLLSNIKDNLLATSDTLAITSAKDEALRRALNRQSAIFELIVIDPQGQVLAQRRRVGEAEPTVTEQPWLATTEIGGVYIGPVDYHEFGVPFADIAVAITDDAGNFSATLVAKVDLTTLWETVTGLQVGETGYIYITDRAGQLLAHPTLQLVQQGTVLENEIGRTPKDITELGIKPYTGLDGKTVIASGTQLTTVPWFVIVEQPISEALRSFAWLSVILLVLLMLVGLLVYNIVIFTRRRIASPLLLLREGVDVLRQGELTYRIDIQTSDEFGDLASTFNTMAAQLQEMVGSLEQRVADRTRGLQTAAEVARAATAVLDRDQLLRRVVDLVRERFNLYYAGLFLVEGEPGSDRKFAVLRAGTGAAGRQMMAQGHRLEVGGDSMIGQCVTRAEARIALDVGAEPTHFDNPFLPETRSEMALPLRSRGRAVGAMTVQSTVEAAFDEADIAVMQTVADQVAVALDNARLFAETQAALAEMESTHRRYLGQAWTKHLARRAVSGYMRTQAGVQRLSDKSLPETQQVTTERQPVILSNGGDRSQAKGSSLAVPILLRDQLIGTLGLRDEGEERQWSADDIALAEAIAEQLALAADNLRLIEETQHRATREQTISEVSARMRETLDMETMLRAASNEMRQALGLDDLVIRLTTTETGDD